jgi:hypothetical protein
MSDETRATVLVDRKSPCPMTAGNGFGCVSAGSRPATLSLNLFRLGQNELTQESSLTDCATTVVSIAPLDGRQAGNSRPQGFRNGRS